jgi:hypothetical protein
MKKVILSLASFMFFGTLLQAQTSKDFSKIDLTGRAADHLMFQVGSDSWTGKPDSVNTSGLSKHFNIYFMMDRPFKKNPHYSLAYGAGIGTSNIMFDDHTKVDVRSAATTLPFTQLDSNANYFAKNKVTTIYLLVPAEIRYYSNPQNPGKSWKLAAGLKIGTLLKSYSKSKNLQTASGGSIYGKGYIEKQLSKRFFNATDLSVTGRAGYGLFAIHAAYQVTGVLREGFGPVMNKVSVGFTISGL